MRSKKIITVLWMCLFLIGSTYEAFAGSGNINLHYASAAPTSSNVVSQYFSFVTSTNNVNINISSFVRSNNTASVYVGCSDSDNPIVGVFVYTSTFSSTSSFKIGRRVYVLSQLNNYTTGGYTASGTVSG